MGAEKDKILDCNRCTCPCLSIAMQAAMKIPAIQKFFSGYIHSRIIRRAGAWCDHLQNKKLSTLRKVRGIEAEDEWWRNNLRPQKGGKARRRKSASSVKAEREIILHNWLAQQNNAVKK